MMLKTLENIDKNDDDEVNEFMAANQLDKAQFDELYQ